MPSEARQGEGGADARGVLRVTFQQFPLTDASRAPYQALTSHSQMGEQERQSE